VRISVTRFYSLIIVRRRYHYRNSVRPSHWWSTSKRSRYRNMFRSIRQPDVCSL